ncbi:MAG TPA: FtsX-like permease family protein, partial [Vicinamibacterales bacterium]|nr:FtsX-like permease family protein [Vicinamibacterales bacterium]
LARLIGGGASVIGRRISEAPLPGKAPSSAEIVGVVSDLIWSTRGVNPMRLFRPRSQRPDLTGRDLTIRASTDAVAAYRAFVDAVHAIDPKVHARPLATVESNLLAEMAPQRFGMTVMGALGAIALLLSALGTYVLAESMATRRRREMGIRAALGASRGELGRLMLSETLRLVTAGLLLGFALCWAGASTIRAFLFQIEPFDPGVTIGVATTIVALAIAISLRPALSASRVDLARVLRED